MHGRVAAADRHEPELRAVAGCVLTSGAGTARAAR